MESKYTAGVPVEETFKIGDRVNRKPLNNFKHQPGINGTIVSIEKYNRYRIKWDEKASTRQQHSTIQGKFLKIITQ